MDYNEGVESTGATFSPNRSAKSRETSPVGPALAAKFPDQFAVGLQLRARRFRWKIGEFGEQTRRLTKMIGQWFHGGLQRRDRTLDLGWNDSLGRPLGRWVRPLGTRPQWGLNWVVRFKKQGTEFRGADRWVFRPDANRSWPLGVAVENWEKTPRFKSHYGPTKDS
jgi:hypothetical protein